MSIVNGDDERMRRWRLALGPESGACAGPGLSGDDARLDAALEAIYGETDGAKKKGSLGASAPRVARWLGDIREFFPTPVVQVIQRDAFDRLGLKQMLFEPEFLAALEADVHLVADIMALRGVIPEKAKETARIVVGKVVKELMERLEDRMVQAIRGTIDRTRRTTRPTFRDIDWDRTIRANLKNWQPDLRTVIPETLHGHARNLRGANLDEVILCIDQSGSMGTSVVYSSIFAAVMASIRTIRTKLVVFDTAIMDLTDQLSDPIEVLFGIQLGGGTNIAGALAHCEEQITDPSRTHLVLISDLYENGDERAMLAQAAALVARGVNVIVLLALSDDGKPASHEGHAQSLASMGIPVFACTPDLFPDLMAAALKRHDIADWAARNDVVLRRAA
jgi:Mg-chelatase subunit ChlD